MTTIIDVAAHAGVSIKSVSRVLNGEAHVRPALREKVEAAVKALGYRPKLAARQLAGNKSFIIAYPFNNPSAAYITDVLMGAAHACRDRGYHLVSEPVDCDGNAKTLIERIITMLQPDGIILTPPLGDMAELAEYIAGFKVPLVRIAGPEGFYGQTIPIDDRTISREMVEHLVEQGHDRIGFILPPPDHVLAQSRYQGYLDGLKAANIKVDEALVRPGRFDVTSGVEAAHALLDLKSPPTAIFAANDDMALGALQVAHSRKMRIPEDVAIAGFDDSPASILAWPALTTVRQPVRQLGARAAMILLGEDAAEVDLRHQLIIRESTVAPPD